MIEIKECSKAFDSLKAVSKVSLDIGEREVFGLVGSNGAGKSTLLRMMAGILKPDEGEVCIDDIPVFDHAQAKEQIFYISDDCYFPANYTALDMAAFYRLHYPKFEIQRFSQLMRQFQLDEKQRVSSFSKGMKKQLMVLLGISAGTKYLLCDETFDGLDPVMRQGVKSLFAAEIMGRDFTPVLASHNLRELEDICDHVGLLYKGGMLLSRDLEDMKFHIHKIQCVFTDKKQEDALKKELDVLKVDHQGSLVMLTARGTRSEIMEKIREKKPLFSEVIPLTLEEIFICETEVAGYEIQNIFF
ncbi:ABC transporter ATP-binding protein [Blautia sp. MSJ-19]|uniref:ABC transporter ATP-binding protein n=1 Tax=Blautia sp. MSJ-19 TaxID=2841517 RepID=UPI001C0EA97E|nr:ABC transporter ATP-binding protein [Blautia sp. MSJ-19]MBU5479976.1 ABC transporter ATP-binding protein [Blautia sp. MSJ-19]